MPNCHNFPNQPGKNIYTSAMITLNPTFASDDHSPCNISASSLFLAVSFITFTINTQSVVANYKLHQSTPSLKRAYF